MFLERKLNIFNRCRTAYICWEPIPQSGGGGGYSSKLSNQGKYGKAFSNDHSHDPVWVLYSGAISRVAPLVRVCAKSTS